MSVSCKACGSELPEEYERALSEGTVCPYCNSTLSRQFTIHLEGVSYAISGGIANLTVITYPEQLLTEVQDLIDKDKFTLAVIAAQMACEISSERALSRAFADKGLNYLEESVSNLLPSRSIANERVRKLYDALTEDNVYDDLKHVWQGVKDLATLRNAAVHRGKICSKGEAEAALKTATELVRYFKQ